MTVCAEKPPPKPGVNQVRSVTPVVTAAGFGRRCDGVSPLGLEPRTHGLKGRCSAIELEALAWRRCDYSIEGERMKMENGKLKSSKYPTTTAHEIVRRQNNFPFSIFLVFLQNDALAIVRDDDLF